MKTFSAGLPDLPARWPTPLELAQFRRFSRSLEINDYLCQLAGSSEWAQLAVWGASVNGTPLNAIHLGSPAIADNGQRLRVVLVGSQHGGSEAAGGEALMVLARQLLHEDLRPLLAHMDIHILANANPDGRDADTSKNAHGVNLNRDYVMLLEPESLAIDQALARIRPHVVLDVHESAALKRKSLGLEGYMTEFQAQLEMANNPGIDAGVQQFSEQAILQHTLLLIATGGLPSQRYIKEIGSTQQPLTHGGITTRNLRNKAGLCGALSFLLETRMDPKDGQYSSFRNIQVRRSKQLFCIRQFLQVISQQVPAILAAVAQLAHSRSAPECVLRADYVTPPAAPILRLPLRRIATQTVTEVEFVNQRHLQWQAPVARPPAYYVTRHTALFAELCVRHSLQFETLAEARHARVTGLRILNMVDDEEGALEVAAQPMQLELTPGCLRIPLNQPRGLLIPQLFEPGSASSVFHYPRFRALCTVNQLLFVYRQ